ncbi:MAG: SIMPL domain-containing protein [Burkholderiaceae bacterium]
MNGVSSAVRTTCGLMLGMVAVAALPAPIATAAESKPPELELQATATGQASNDEMVVHLSAEQSGADIGQMNEKVLQALRTALDTAKGVAGVRARAGSVTTQPIWDKDGKRTGWRVNGAVVLEGADLKATGELAGRLSKDLQLASVQYRLTPGQRAQAENKLIEDAAAAFRERARRATAALGFREYEIKSVSIQTSASGPRPPPMPRAMRMASEAAVAVPDEGGEATVDITLTGTVVLR